MDYRYLPEHLRPIADATIRHLREEHGLTRFKAEEEAHRNLQYRPTLHTVTEEGQIICVEVVDEPFSANLQAVVLECVRLCLPVKLYVAFPVRPPEGKPGLETQISQAKKYNLGILEVAPPEVQNLADAQPLSFLGVRPIDKARFPAKYRRALSEAEATFKQTSPVKGCSLIFDEIESLSRKIAITTRDNGFWRKLKPGEKSPRINLETGAWQKAMETLSEHIDRHKFSPLTVPLMGKLLGVVPHRNESGHKPGTVAVRMQREQQLRTRFENAVDLLHDLIEVEKLL